MKVTEKVADAIVRLRGNPDFTIFIEWVAENRQLSMVECTQHIEHPKVLRAQGKYQVLEELTSVVEKAPVTLERFRR